MGEANGRGQIGVFDAAFWASARWWALASSRCLAKREPLPVVQCGFPS